MCLQQPVGTSTHILGIMRGCDCRLLNHLPAARMTAMALEAFLKAAGFRMHRVYGRQFQKLLGHIDSVFLPDLEKQGDPEARPVMSRCAAALLRALSLFRNVAKHPCM